MSQPAEPEELRLVRRILAAGVPLEALRDFAAACEADAYGDAALVVTKGRPRGRVTGAWARIGRSYSRTCLGRVESGEEGR